MMRPIPKRTYWIALSVSLFLTTCCLAIYIESQNKLDQEYSKQVESVGSMIAQDILLSVHDNTISLENLKERIVESDGAFMSYFKSDATRITNQNEAIKFVEWIDKDGIIREVHPLEENKAAFLLDIKPIEYRYADWLQNSIKERPNMTAWVQLTQTGRAFLIDIPMYIDDAFYGTVTAGMDFSSKFDELTRNFENIAIRIRDEEDNEFYNFNDFDSVQIADNNVYTSFLRPVYQSRNEWTVDVLFLENALFKERDIIHKIALSYGVLISMLVGFLIVYFLRWKHHSEQQIIINDTLTELNHELEAQKLAAQEASLHKSDFISNMSHEIRTPLNAILGFVEILHAKELLRNERLYLKLMKRSAQNLLGLVNDILDINKIEAGKAELSPSVFKPSKNLKQVLATYKSQMEAKGIKLYTDFSSHSNYLGFSDSSKFDQISTNLISNAIKFTSSGSIHVHYDEEVKNEKLWVTYTVRDTGVGIPEDKLSAIFKRFVQVENGTRKKHVGGGLGLAITSELVKMLNGTVKVDSTEGVGTYFKITIPMELSSAVNNDQPIEVPDLSHLSCLIVDDNRINRMILYNFLQETGLQISNSNSGKNALEKTIEHPYDLVFMDIHMPGMDGFETTQELLKVCPESIVIGVSADVTVEAIRKGKNAGMIDYLTKPIDKNILFKTIGRLCTTEPQLELNLEDS